MSSNVCRMWELMWTEKPHVGANYTRVPRLSIDEEADIDLKNKHNQTPLAYALERKFLK